LFSWYSYAGLDLFIARQKISWTAETYGGSFESSPVSRNIYKELVLLYDQINAWRWTFVGLKFVEYFEENLQTQIVDNSSTLSFGSAIWLQQTQIDDNSSTLSFGSSIWLKHTKFDDNNSTLSFGAVVWLQQQIQIDDNSSTLSFVLTP
jgi:hypothetical protein